MEKPEAGGGPIANIEAIQAALASGKVLPPGGASDEEINAVLALLDLSDLGNAYRFIARHGLDVLYVEGIGWHTWDGRRWAFDDKGKAAQRRAHDTARSIVEEVAALKANPPSGWASANVSQRCEKLMAWSVSCGDSRRVRGMLVEAEPYLTVKPEVMDADPYLLNLENGTLVLRGACNDLREHRREDRLSKVMQVSYDPKAGYPQFQKFLDRVQPRETGVADFLQRWSGYALTGATDEQKLTFHFGGGANGKSVFLVLRGRMMGPYSAAVDFSSLAQNAAKRGDAASPDLARLPGVRFARVSEVDKGVRLSEAFAKQVTGGDAITVRHLNREFFEFEPCFKLEMQGNHKPMITGADEGIWRRIVLVPWTVTIPPEERDHALSEKLWAERSGILNWMLDGLRRWLDPVENGGGLPYPEAVREATAEYRLDSDPLGRFIASVVEKTDDLNDQIQAKDLFQHFCDWCAESGEKPWSQTAFGRGVIERGLRRIDGRFRMYVGVKFRPYALEEACEGS